MTRREVLAGLAGLLAASSRQRSILLRDASVFEAPFVADALRSGTLVEVRVDRRRIWIRAHGALLGWVPVSDRAVPARLAAVSRCPAGRLVIHVA